MTLYELIVGGGVLLSVLLMAVLPSLWPARRTRCIFTMTVQRKDEAVRRALVPSRRNVLPWPHRDHRVSG